MMLVGLTGVARSGKDAVGKYLEDHYNFLTYAFADPIRKVAHEMFGLPVSAFSGDNPDREVPDPFWGISPREMLQKIGTEGARDVFDPDIWVKRAKVRWDTLQASHELDNQKLNLPAFRGVALTDVRFDNEAAWIREEGGLILQLTRIGTGAVNMHRSEAGVDRSLITHYINNNGTLDDLHTNVRELFDQIM